VKPALTLQQAQRKSLFWRLHFWAALIASPFVLVAALGIPFHRGEFGWWNQALLLAFGLSVLFSLGSGWVMFFKRRRPGSFGSPRVMPGAWRAVPVGAWLGAAVLCVGLPLLAISAAVLLVLEAMLALAKPVSTLPIP
jgi:uncharacterized iron-regulated membrane protein